MYDESPISVITCENCSTPGDPNKKFCSQCSFPIGGTDEEKTSFRLIVSSRKRLLSDAQDKIKSARIAILVLAGIFFVSGLIIGFGNDDFETMIVNLVLCVIYLVLAAWANQNPFGAILTAFIIYVTLQVVNGFLEPTSIIRGVIIKVFVIAAFVKGIRSAHEAQGYLKELEKLKAQPIATR